MICKSLLLICIFTLFATALPASDAMLRFSCMGTVAQITVSGSLSQTEYLKIVRQKFHAVEKIANLYDPHSELSRLNATAAAKPFVCSKELYELLKYARMAYICSDGAFDISAKPLMDLWGFYRKRQKMPQAFEIREVLQRVGLNKVVFDDKLRSVFFTRPGMALDLGGIAKGYALDLAAEALQNHIDHAVFDLGGNLLILNLAGEFTTAAIRDPLSNRNTAAFLQINNGALSTSGGYEKFRIYNSRRYAHIINPATGYPAEGILSVTSITSSAAEADWMSTAVFIGGEALARKLVEQFPGSGFYIFKAGKTPGKYTRITVKQSYPSKFECSCGI